MTVEYPIDLVHADGSIHRLATPLEASSYRYAFHERHVVAATDPDGRVVVSRNEWIARDALGATVRAEDIPPLPRRAWWTHRLDEARRAAELGLPIPGTGVRRRIGVRAYDHCLPERGSNADCRRLASAGFRVDHRVRDRLPRSWDDGSRRRPQRCWKEQRAHRWIDRGARPAEG